MPNLSLLSTQARVETPYIIVTIGGYTFGVYSKKVRNIINSGTAPKSIIANYPNFIQSLSVEKLNGRINTYTLNLIYAIQKGDDPNLLEKVFSKASSNRRITLSYGDLSAPSYIYKEEEALITSIRSNVDMRNSTITYTLQCTSSSQLLLANSYNFPKTTAKPSDIIKKLLYSDRYGALEVFYGMTNKDMVMAKGLIASDDKEVEIEAKTHISLFDYITYLVSCMSNINDKSDSILDSTRYIITTYDDTTGEFGGPYFKVAKVEKDVGQYNSLNAYTLDVGFPGASNVIGFTIEDNENYSILYDYSKEIDQSIYTYRINNNGQIEELYAPKVATSSTLLKTTQAEMTWWSQTTRYPITVQIELQGLIKPAVLMSYVNLNVLFYGREHISSGVYIITKQTDTISSNGFRTTLKMTRIPQN